MADPSVNLTQPRMIERILKLVNLDPHANTVKMHDTPANERKLLDKDPDAQPRQQSWNYCSVVGCLGYLQAMIRPDITMSVQQVSLLCVQYCVYYFSKKVYIH